MKLIDRIKKWWKRGGDTLTAVFKKEHYNSILDHPSVNFDAAELARIEDTFRLYQGKYPKVQYLNTYQEQVERDYIHLNLIKVVSNYMTTLVFNEQCQINIGVADEETGDYPESDEATFVQEILERTKFKRSLTEKLEPMFATGGIVVRPYYDASSKQIDFSWCLADAFIPLRSNTDEISEGVIPTVTTIVIDGKTHYYTLLEFHEWEDDLYILSNELYHSEDASVLGKRVDLTEVDAFAKLEPMTIIEGLSRPLFAYLKPAGFNNLSPRSPLGLGLLDHAKPTCKAINDVYDEFWWEIKDGKQRKIVTDHFIDTVPIDGSAPKRIFDKQSSAFVALPGAIDDMVHRDITNQIRSQQYIESINAFLSSLEFQIELSSGTFNYSEAGGLQTATEVVSKESKTFRTRNKHVEQVREFIKDLIISTFELAKYVKINDVALYSGRIPERDEIGIDFDDGVFTDKQAELEFLSQATLAGFIPKIEASQRLFDVPLATARSWQKDIKDDLINTSYDTASRLESTFLGGEE